MDHQPTTMESPDDGRLDVAVVGMAGRFPEARTIDELWRNIRDGRNCIRRFSTDALIALGVPRQSTTDAAFVPAAPVLPDDPGLFDAEFFGFSPREAALLDPQHRLLLECAWEALEHAGYDPARAPAAVGVYASSSLSAYLLFNILTRPELVHPSEAAQAMFCNDKDFVSTRLSYELNLRGPSVTVQTACSSSLVAIHTACQALLTHDCDMAIAGGVSIHVPQRIGYYFVDGGYQSPDGCCRPFDARAAGTVFGSGAGVVVLKRLSDAVAARDTIQAVVRGTAINNDGSGKVGFTAPSVDGQADAIVRAHAMADVDAGSIGFVETHGTATALGDAVEIAALRKAFESVTGRRRCALGSVKANLGHLDAAAGVTGFIKTVLAVRDGVIPPMAHFERANPALALDESPFFVPAEAAAWPESRRPRRAAVSSFGIGGTNAHAVLEEPPTRVVVAEPPADRILAISARTATALDAATARLADCLERDPDLPLSDASYTLLTGRPRWRLRRFVVCSDGPQAIAMLRDPEAPTTCTADERERPVAFLFPGGGAQHPGMGAETYAGARVFREALDRCAALLVPTLGVDLRRIIYPEAGEVERARTLIAGTRFAMPALVSVEYALACLWMSWGLSPRAMLGHSLGEYAAAAVSGVMSLPDALDLVALRGALVERLPPGAMVSVALSPDELAPLLEDTEIAAINAPAQCVVSGLEPAIDRLIARLADRGVEHRRIQIRIAGHSSLVDPILDEFGARASTVELHAPTIPYVSCLTGDWIDAQIAGNPRYWVDHFRGTVRFADAIARLTEQRPQTLLELGPGRTLGSLARANATNARASDDIAIVPTWPHALDAPHDRPIVLAAAAKVWALGGSLDWNRFFAEERRRRIPLPAYPFERQRHWIEPQTGERAPRASAAKIDHVDNWFYAPTWRETRTSPADAPYAGTCLIVADDQALAPAVEAALARRGARAITARLVDGPADRRGNAYEIRALVLDDYRALVARLRDAGTVPDAVIHLGTCGVDSPASLQERGLQSLVNVARAFDAECAGRRLFVLLASDRMFDVSGVEHAVPDKAMLAAPCLVIPQEYSEQRCQCVDVGDLSSAHARRAVAERLVEELAAGVTQPRVAYRSDRRWVEHVESIAPAGGSALLEEGGVYLILGGLGRVGARIAEHIGRRSGRLAIVSRTAQPASVVRMLEAAGAEVAVFQGDVADTARMTAIADRVAERFGRINGIVHAAGASGATTVHLMHNLDARVCAADIAARVDGVRSVGALVEHVHPDFCLLVSSNATWLGGVGSIAYTAGHLVSAAYAMARGAAGATRWMAVDWDGWPALDGALSVGRVRTTLDQYVMTPEECGLALDRVLSPNVPRRLIVSTGDAAARRRQWVTFERAAIAAPATRPDAATTSGSAPAPPRTENERTMVALWEEVLGVSPVGVSDNFFDLGGNSLMALKVVSRLTRATGGAVSLTSIFEAPTPRALALLLRDADDQTIVDASRSRGAQRRRQANRRVPLETSEPA